MIKLRGLPDVQKIFILVGFLSSRGIITLQIYFWLKYEVKFFVIIGQTTHWPSNDLDLHIAWDILIQTNYFLRYYLEHLSCEVSFTSLNCFCGKLFFLIKFDSHDWQRVNTAKKRVCHDKCVAMVTIKTYKSWISVPKTWELYLSNGTNKCIAPLGCSEIAIFRPWLMD